MCGRFVLTPDERFYPRFGLGKSVPFPADYNITPGKDIQTLIKNNDGSLLKPMYWGLIPPWTTFDEAKFKPINVRSESLSAKPMFKDVYRKHRCLIPATGFYEWKKLRSGVKQPYYFYSATTDPYLVFAGVYSVTTKDNESEPFYSCAIITVPATAKVERVHSRQPLMLTRQGEKLWMGDEQPDSVQIRQESHSKLEYHPVSSRVNSPGNNSQDLLQPVNHVAESE